MNRSNLHPITHAGSFMPPAQGVLQRQCSCGNRTAGGQTCEECSKKKNSLQRQMRVGSSNDPLENEADRVAEQVLANQTAPAISSFSFGQIQREDKPKEKTNEEKYKDGGKKIGEAFLKTPVGKEILDTVKEGALGNWTGRIITGSAAIGTVVALAASEEELPMQVPEIPLDFITPGFSVELAYNGPVNKPTSAMLTFKFKEQVPAGGSKAPTAAEKFRADTAKMAADQAKFKAGLITPGSPEDLQQKAEQEAIHNVVKKMSGGFDLEAEKKKYPWLATPEPKTGLQLNKPTFGYQGPSVFGDQFKLKLFDEKKKKSDETGLQKKLSIGSSHDPLEAEADRVADQVVGNSAKAAHISSAISSVQRHSTSAAETSNDVPDSVNQTLSGSGKPLDKTTLADMESRFGHDFSQVRIHQGNTAEKSARDVNANAYTLGSNIVFGAGQFNPESQTGKRLLAHELTHVVQQNGSSSQTIARAPNPKAPKSNFTPQQQARLEQARLNQKADGTRIVGVLITPDGQEYEFISGGPGRFYAHIEGKAVAKMNELGIQKGVLLVEKEPCQTCDRSTYTYDPLQPSKGGPEVPLASSKTGAPLAREPSMINTGLHKGSELKVVDPVSTGIYRGLKTPPSGTATANPVIPAEPDIKPGPLPAKAVPAPQDTPKQPAANKPAPAPKAPVANGSTPLKPVGTPGAPAKAPSLAEPANNKPPAAKVGPPVPVPAKPSSASNSGASDGERQRFSAPVGAFSRPGNFADDANAKAQAKGNAAILVVQGVLAILTYFADKYQRERADAAWAEAYPRIQEEVTRTGRGVVVYVEYTQNTGSSVLIFEGIHWTSGGYDGGQPGSLRAPGQTASFSRSYVGPTEAQASITDETALIFRRDEARTKQRELQGMAELMAREGWLGRKLRERAGDSINPLRVYDAKAHIVSASQSIKDKRYSDAAASLDKADAAMDEMWAQIKTYVGEKKLKELSGEK